MRQNGHDAPLPQSARQLGHDDRIGLAEPIGVLLSRPGLIGLDEREQQLGCARFARGGAIDQLFDRRLELGDAPAAAVLVHRDPFAQSRGDDRAEVARALRPAARVAGLAGPKSGRIGRPAIADPLVRNGWLQIPLFVLALAHGAASLLAPTPPRAAGTASKASPVVANRAKPPV